MLVVFQNYGILKVVSKGKDNLQSDEPISESVN